MTSEAVTSPNPAEALAIVGSPSTNLDLTLNLTAKAYDESLVGAMVYVNPRVGTGEEFALGTVTQVKTTNQWHQNASLLGVVKDAGEIPGLTADGDIRSADVKVQSAHSRKSPTEPWGRGGPSLSMSPPTGTKVHRVTTAVLHDLVPPEEHAGLAYLGTVYRNGDVLLPCNMRDFADDRGAIHSGIFGTTGAGKSGIASITLASQMRHEKLGILFIDPQGEFSNDGKTLIPLQGLARSLGRHVEVLRITHDIQLQKDGPLLCSLLLESKEFFNQLDFTSNAEVLGRVVRAIQEHLEDLPTEHSWEKQSSEDVLRRILDHLDDEEVVSRVIKNKDRQKDILRAIQRAKTDAAWRRLLDIFKPLHNLFLDTNLDGRPRKNLWGVLAKVLDPDLPGARPYIVLNMSGGSSSASGAYRILDNDELKARILRKVVTVLALNAASKYAEDKPLNTLVMFDEAHRYAPPVTQDKLPEAIKELSSDLARHARETRKYGVGWTYITQTIRSLHPAIFDMLGIRICGYGLSGSDLRALEDHLDSSDSLDLYRTFPNPEQTGEYPYMIAGTISPIAVGKAPSFLTALSPEAWLEANRTWIQDRVAVHNAGLGHVTLRTLRDQAPSALTAAARSPRGNDPGPVDPLTSAPRSLPRAPGRISLARRPTTDHALLTTPDAQEGAGAEGHGSLNDDPPF